MTGNAPNTRVGTCPKCSGDIIMFDGPWFSGKPKPARCVDCGYIVPPPGNENTVYIGW